MNQYFILCLVLAGLNVITFGLLVFIFMSSQKMVDKLTSKLMSRDVNEYTIATTNRVKETPKNAIRNQDDVPIDEADPNDVLRSLAASTGRMNDFEEI